MAGKQDNLEELEKLMDRRKAEVDRLKKLALISEKRFDLDVVSEKTQRDEIRTEIDRLETEIAELEKCIAGGIGEIKFPLKSPEPEISNGNSVFHFEEDTYDNWIGYLRSAFSMTDRLIIDHVLFCPDKIVVMGTTESDEATDRLVNATQTIRTFGSILLGKEPPEMEKALDFLNSSKYKHLWEFIGSKGEVSTKEVYSTFRLEDEIERKRARTFYSQLESRLTLPVVTGDGKGNFQLTAYGRLVWVSYKRTYTIPKAVSEKAEGASPVQEKRKEFEEQKSKKIQTALQNFFNSVLLSEDD